MRIRNPEANDQKAALEAPLIHRLFGRLRRSGGARLAPIGRGVHQAVAMARSAIRSGKQWAVTADTRKCFDAVDHNIPMRQWRRDR